MRADCCARANLENQEARQPRAVSRYQRLLHRRPHQHPRLNRRLRFHRLLLHPDPLRSQRYPLPGRHHFRRNRFHPLRSPRQHRLGLPRPSRQNQQQRFPQPQHRWLKSPCHPLRHPLRRFYTAPLWLRLLRHEHLQQHLRVNSGHLIQVQQ